MTRIKLKSVEVRKNESTWQDREAVKAVVNVTVPLPNRRSLEQDVTIQRIGDKWYATVALDDFPAQETPEAAADKLSQWLLSLSKGIKGRNIKYLRLAELFNPKHVR